MIAIPRGHRIMFGIIFAAALLVAVLGSFFPAVLADMFSWLELPPLHARFVGALYFYGAIFMIGCLRARYQAEVRHALLMIAIWTGLLFVVSIISLSAFDFSQIPVWVWFASYLIYPIVAIVMTVRDREPVTDDLPGSPVPAWARLTLQVQGALGLALALPLLLAPDFMVSIWPWRLTPLRRRLMVARCWPIVSGASFLLGGEHGLGSELSSRRCLCSPPGLCWPH
jgi:hypothetical protein